jgi:predicted nuclease of predicted toxin-antitoxin system
MQFKIDENLHSDAADRLRRKGHDAMTVRQQGLRGAADSDIADVCRRENRVIVTLDLDFSDVRVYPPQDYHGIIVLRLADQSRTAVVGVLDRILPMLETDSPVGKLWIVDEHQVRIRSIAP